MFRRITEYVEGDACVNCWGEGKTFGDIVTPKRIYITGSGFAGACAPCNNTFIAEQDAIAPCQWNFNNGTVLGDWTVGPVFTLFHLAMVGGPECYAQTGGLCARESTFAGKSMSIEIAEPPTPEYKIAIDQNFSPSLQTHFLNLGAANGDEVLVLARRRDRVKLHVRFSPVY